MRTLFFATKMPRLLLHLRDLIFDLACNSFFTDRQQYPLPCFTGKHLHLQFMHIGLYFGSFNPIHVGHLIIANYVLQHSTCKQIWFVVSPHNPLKESSSLLNEQHRYHLVRLAIEDEPAFKASNIEFTLPRPSYTIDTLTYLAEKHPEHTFSIIMGSDSLQNLPKWKNFQKILDHYPLLVYQRPNAINDAIPHTNITMLHAPMLDISATFIRACIRDGKSIKYLVQPSVEEYILANKYYR
jgi:nicotinate-nucleotide adenylyltransferase